VSDIRVSIQMLCLTVLMLGLPAGILHAQAEPAGVQAGARVLRVSFTGWIQPRYEFSHVAGGENLSSFLLRRARLDVQGTVLDERLTFRIMPDFSRAATLRDGWTDFAFSPALRVRFGQFTVPFQWHRYVGPRRQHFAERGVPSETFGFPNGRDVGIMVHGRNTGETVQWQIGVFDGAGRNVAASNSSGNMASGRLSLALLGTLPREEMDLVPSPSPLVSAGGGVQGATRNEARAWALQRSAGDRADWLTGTGDIQVRWRGFSLAADGYLRRVWPDDGAVDSYTGAAGMISTGMTIIPNRLDAVARWSTLRLDRNEPDTGHRQWGGGLNIYAIGHDSKIRIQYLNDRTNVVAGNPIRAGAFLIEYHVQF
jgi:hypothetical protein